MAEPRNILCVGLVSLAKDRSTRLENYLGDKCPPPHKKTKELGEVGRADATYARKKNKFLALDSPKI